jgi:hypothetical protein
LKRIGRRSALLVAIAAVSVLGMAGSASAASTLTPTDFDFGNQTVGTTSGTQNFALDVGQQCFGPPFPFCIPDFLSPVISVTGPFTQTNDCAVPPGAPFLTSDCTVGVAFQPVHEGLANGTLTTGAGTATLRGTGVAPAASGQSATSTGTLGQEPHKKKKKKCKKGKGAKKGSASASKAKKCGKKKKSGKH